MRLADFDFDLPEASIALRPASPRDSARLLLVQPSEALVDQVVRDLPDLLQPGDALVFNDTRVIPARLNGERPARAEGGGDGAPVTIEAMLHRRLSPDRWAAFARPAKRIRAGDTLRFGDELSAEVAEKGEGGEIVLAFDQTGARLDAAIGALGHMPLPPYIASKRPEDERDRADYQTVYAKADGSVAAPTAGLHFTPELLARLAERGVSQHFVTLHVGAGTFLPVKVDDIAEHRMHPEFGVVTAETAAALNAVHAACVGTTALRLIESASGEDGQVRPFADETAIFITPGYRFRAADGLMTNFHLPKSTLFMLVSAFAGQATMRSAYEHAIATGYRFYSYGDSSLLWAAPR